MYHEDEFYGEPSEFEEQIEVFKESLRNSVKNEVQSELQRLRDENASLREFKQQKEKMERDHKSAMQQIEYDKEKFKRDVMRMRLTELLGDLSFRMWFVSSRRIEIPKCDACDESRRIHYKTPSGKDAVEDCPTCGTAKFVSEPEEIEGYKFHQHKGSWGGNYPHPYMYFRRKEERDYDSFEKCRNIYNGEPFEKVNSWDLSFINKEDCQKYCDWVNSRRK